MRDQRPYLLRALNDWILDSGCTPHLLVDASRHGVEVPESAVSDGRVILNIAPAAVHDLVLGDDAILFEARFAGVPRPITVPIDAVLAIYARENGTGMAFESDPETSTDAGDEEPPPEGPPPGRPGLRVVK
jgi:stringent starvation protein B